MLVSKYKSVFLLYALVYLFYFDFFDTRYKVLLILPLA